MHSMWDIWSNGNIQSSQMWSRIALQQSVTVRGTYSLYVRMDEWICTQSRKEQAVLFINGYCRLCFFLLVFTVSLHVSAYMAIFRCVGYFIFICLKDLLRCFFLSFFSRGHTLHVSICFLYLLQADKHTRKETTKITKENRGKNTTGNMQSKTTWKKKAEKQRSRILQAYENKISYTPEDGHVGRNI
jgi:hypothetical protein